MARAWWLPLRMDGVPRPNEQTNLLKIIQIFYIVINKISPWLALGRASRRSCARWCEPLGTPSTSLHGQLGTPSTSQGEGHWSIHSRQSIQSIPIQSPVHSRDPGVRVCPSWCRLASLPLRRGPVPEGPNRRSPDVVQILCYSNFLFFSTIIKWIVALVYNWWDDTGGWFLYTIYLLWSACWIE